MKGRSLFSLIVSLSILMKNQPLMGLIVSLVVLGTGCSPVFAQSQQYPTNEQLNVLDIAATAGWINTNVYVKRGWRVKISARGRWSNGNYKRSDRTVFRPFYGPDGFSDTSDPTTELLVPTTLAGSLIGRIGNSQPFAIGSNLTFVAANDGWLYLSMNDKPGTFNDNQGSVNVTVQYTSNQTITGRSPSPSQQTTTGTGLSVLLQQQGVLAKGDSVLSSDGSLYDQYTFQGSAGQTVTITVESAEFDTYVAIITPDGKLLAENDDINQSNKNAGLTVTLPGNGTYRVIVNGYDKNSRGRYAVSVSMPTQQTVTGRSPSPNQQTNTGRSPSPSQQNPQRQTRINGDDTIVYNNIVCNVKTRNFLGQESPASCRSKEADSRLIFNSITWERQADRSIKVEIKVFNQGSAEALVEIYDSKNRLVDLKIIDGNKPPTGLIDSGIDMFTRFPISLFNQYPLTDTRKNLNEQEFSDNKKNSIIIPSGGSLKITKSSNQAWRYNAALLSLELALLGLGDPKFAEDETVKQFVKRFAQEAYFSPTSKGTINIFKSEPSAQAMFRMDLVDPNKAAQLLQQFVQYTLTVESDPSKNPFIGPFLDVYKDVGNIGLEIALDKFILPGLGTFAKNTRIAGSTLNTFARAADLYYAMAAGEKANITLEDADRLK